MLADYFTKPLQGALLHKFRDISIVRVSTFTLLEDKVSYTSKACVAKHISSKEIPPGTGYPLKETENMLEEEIYKQVRTIT